MISELIKISKNKDEMSNQLLIEYGVNIKGLGQPASCP